jgi:glycosyltransferase involved in cell wall biosynthesis
MENREGLAPAALTQLRITATIITLNEAENIRAACESVAWADEVLVVDAKSNDATREIAAECGARVIEREWPGFAAQKQFAAENAAHEWIFSLDADERVSDDLRASIAALREADPAHLADGYRVARRSFYMGRAYVHESVKMDTGARVDNLQGDLHHFSVLDAAHHHRMIGERYAPLAAQQMFEAGRRTTPFTIALAAPSAFLRSFLLKGGFRDGVAGLAIASFAAHHAFLKHVLLWEKQNGRVIDR